MILFKKCLSQRFCKAYDRKDYDEFQKLWKTNNDKLSLDQIKIFR